MLPFASPHRVQLAGRRLYSEPFSLSSGRCRFAFSVHREGEVRFSFVGGAELNAAPSSVSTHFVDSFFPAPPRLSPERLFGSAGSGFYHRRVSSQLRFVDLLFRAVCCIGRRSPPPVRFRLPVRGGAASIASLRRESTAHFSESLLSRPSLFWPK